MAALYLHIPFCRSKCLYCSFSSSVAGEQLYGPYVAALLQELSGSAKMHNRQQLTSLFVGGGTPTCLPPALLQKVIVSAGELFGVTADAEISVEANPGTVDAQYLATLLEAGVNRLSFGVQSFDDRELTLLGRIHTKQEASSAIRTAMAAGFHNISLDLMYGLPGQTPVSWQQSLTRALSFLPQHLSLYQLTIEPDTPFYSLLENNSIILPGEEEILQMDEITEQLCKSAGLKQYEISNYATKGQECRHNINYWRNGEYYAAGASAVSCLHGVRERRLADTAEYIRRIGRNESVVIETEHLSRDASFRETVIMGLRLVRGVSRKNLRIRYGMDLEEYYGETLAKLLRMGMLQLTATHLQISKKGWPLSNRIMAELV